MTKALRRSAVTLPFGEDRRHDPREEGVVAVAQSILVIASRILRDGTTYRELGHDSFDKPDTADSSTASSRA